MKTFIFQTSLILGALAAGTTGLLADESAFQASLTPDIAIHPRTTQINGLALNIWGENPQSSLNLGFVNGSTGDSQGLSWGLLNYADSYTGVEWAWINVSREKFYGWQDAFIKDVYKRQLPGETRVWVGQPVCNGRSYRGYRCQLFRRSEPKTSGQR